MKKLISSLAGASLLAFVLVTQAVATPITGSIAFNGAPNLNTSSIATATGIVGYDSGWVAVGQQTGIYTAVADMTPVVFSPFVFSPASQVVAPLWSFSSLGSTYSFSTTSMVSFYNASLKIWNFGGSGILRATGYDDTVGEWNFSTGQIGQSFYFGSAAAATSSVPDNGLTVLMLGLGLGLVGLKSFSRRVAA